MLCGLILAGGMGKRLWPLSSYEKPKQFLELNSGKSLLRCTFENMLELMPMEQIFVSTKDEYVSLVKEQLPELEVGNIIVDDGNDGLATSIMVSTMKIEGIYENSKLMITPCNYIVEDVESFKNIVDKYLKALDMMKGEIISFGLEPKEYKERDLYFTTYSNMLVYNSSNFYRTLNCRVGLTKEMFKIANSFGNTVIGTGIYLGETQTIINAIKSEWDNESVKMQDIMRKICIVPIDVDIKRVINWEDVDDTTLVDNDGNIILGDIEAMTGKNNVVVASERTVTINNMSNVYVMETMGKIIIGKREELTTLKAV